VRQQSRSLVSIVFLTVFIDLLGFGIVIPLLPLYAERLHPTRLQFDLLVCSYSVMQFLCAPILGRISDRVGRRPVLIVSLFGTVIGYVIFAFAHSMAALFVARLIDGATGGNISTAQAVIADTTTPEERTKGMGFVGMAFGLGFIFGPAIGGFAVRLGEAAPGLFAAGLSASALVFAFLKLPETRPVGTAVRPLRVISFASLSRSFRRPAVSVCLLLVALTTTAFSSFEVTFSQFLKARFAVTLSVVSWLFVAIGITAAFAQGFLIKRLVPRFGEVRLVAAGALLLLTGFLLLPWVPGLPSLLPVVVLIALGSGILVPSLSGLVSRRTTPEAQGEVLGSFQSMSSLGRIVGPFFGEDAYLKFGARGPHAIAAVLEALAFVLSTSWLPRQDERP
jgi:multidrug resistance protein